MIRVGVPQSSCRFSRLMVLVIVFVAQTRFRHDDPLRTAKSAAINESCECHENGVIATKMQSTKPAKTNESTPRTNKGSRVQIPLVRPRKPVVPPFSTASKRRVFRYVWAGLGSELRHTAPQNGIYRSRKPDVRTVLSACKYVACDIFHVSCRLMRLTHGFREVIRFAAERHAATVR